MQLTPHFSLAEFTASAKAAELRIDNSLPPELMPAALLTAQMMERIRACLGELAGREVPITVTSGFRCLKLNRAVGSKDNGDHPRMQAIDWGAPSFGTPYEICKALVPRLASLGVGQLIHECPIPGHRWVHTSRRTPDKLANRVITITAAGPQFGIQAVA